MGSIYKVLADLEQGTPEWLAVRARHITATEVAHLWAGRETFEHLKALKTGAALPPDLSHTQSIKEGKFFEPLIRAEALKRWGPKMLPAGCNEIPTPCVERLDEPFFMASLDGLCAGGIPLEIKNTASSNPDFADVRNNGINSKVARYYGYYAQVQWQLYCTGSPFCIFLMHHSEDGVHFVPRNFLYSRVNRDERVIAELVKLGLAFKAYLQEGIEPKDLIVNGHVFFASTDAGLAEKVNSYRKINSEYELLNAQIKSLREKRADLAKEIVEQNLPAGSSKFDGQGFHLAKIERKGSIDAEALCAELLNKGLVNRDFIEQFRKQNSVSYSVRLD